MQTQRGSIPAFYQPGMDGDSGPSGGEMQPAQGSSLAPQELPKQASAGEWVLDAQPEAGPAPRNAISGGVLDVGVVSSAPEGKAQVAPQTHGIEPSESGRLYILELYQDVLEERDALLQEVGALTTELERQQGEVDSLRGTLSADQAAVDALKQELALLKSENADLVARLTTAQIRRLEAEKMLIQAKIEAQQKMLDEQEPLASGVAMQEQNP